MVHCSRFLPALLCAFAYGCLVPIAVLARMGKAGWHWIWNDPAFGFFMVAVFPFAVAVLCCAIDIDLVKRAVTKFSKLTVPVLIYAGMLILVGAGVCPDFVDVHRVHQPYIFQDINKVNQLAKSHDQIFSAGNFDTGGKIYREEATGSLSTGMTWLFLICNFINVSAAVTVFCYILLASTNGPISPQTCNHLSFVLVAFAVWFPCRAYADWYMNLTDVSWIASYSAAWVLAFLLLAACVVLALRMIEGSLYHRFVIPAAAVSAAVGALAARKPKLLTSTALALANFRPVFLAGFALTAVALLYYVSSSIHQRATQPE